MEDEEAKSEMDALIQSLEERRRNENYVRVKALAPAAGAHGGVRTEHYDPEPGAGEAGQDL